jgi:pyruvate kinase
MKTLAEISGMTIVAVLLTVHWTYMSCSVDAFVSPRPAYVSRRTAPTVNVVSRATSSTFSSSSSSSQFVPTVASAPKVAQRWRKSTKQLSTLGPASSSREMIEKLFLAGADCFRLNFSHGSQEQKKELLMTIREIEEKYSHPIGILGDLQGPKLRVGEFSNPNGEMLEAGRFFRLDLDTALGDSSRVNLPHPEIIGASEIGHTLMIDDGKVKLTVVEKGDDYLNCVVDVPGKISNRKGVNTPDSILQISPLTPKDRSDLEYMLKIGVDWVALSFVQQPQDIEEIHEIIDSKIADGEFKPSIMAKIEKPSCFEGDNLQRIVELCDGIMVARGDVSS